jgi:hypothetical protein
VESSDDLLMAGVSFLVDWLALTKRRGGVRQLRGLDYCSSSTKHPTESLKPGTSSDRGVHHKLQQKAEAFLSASGADP